jgi:hypothetical protein
MKKRIVSMLCGVVIVSLIQLPNAIAHESARIAELEQRVQALEKLLGSMGGEAKAAIANPSNGNWTDPNSWNKLKEGMSFGQVESILGKPTEDNLFSDGDGGKWFYEGVVGGSTRSGFIFFFNRRVASINEPVF